MESTTAASLNIKRKQQESALKQIKGESRAKGLELFVL